MIRRWCCAEYKEIHGADRVTLLGIRREESSRRAKRKEVEVSGRKYSENFDQFSEHQEQMIACVKGRDKIMISPILDWTEKEVWKFLNEYLKVEHCELYDRGYTRIGCILCPMENLKGKMRDLEEYPYVAKKWAKTIKWLSENVWKDNPSIVDLNVEERMRWWLSGMSLNEFYIDHFHPKLFNEIGDDKLDVLIKKAIDELGGVER